MSTFTYVLGNIENGVFSDELSETIGDVVQKVLAYRKVGSIAVNLKVSPNGEAAVTVAATVKAKAPEKTRPITTFFADEHGNLLRRDPRQHELALRDVTDTKTETLRTA